MGCGSCGSGGKPAGCRSKGYCSTGGCQKREVFDWLSNMRPLVGADKLEVVSLRFKNGRKEFYSNDKGLSLRVGEAVVVAGSPGYDIGTVALTGALVHIELRTRAPELRARDLPGLCRKATAADLQTWRRARAREHPTMLEGRALIAALGLGMKLSDVEYQADGTKATFYYTAEERVDFRQLIKDLASRFGIRVEMKQIGYRQEAARLGGLGSCGRELCCATWLRDFRSVTTSVVRYQQLSINPQKLVGQCGKLKCCLNYELDAYREALKEFPDTRLALQTEKGEARFQKLDVFQQWLWYAYAHEPFKLIKLSLQAAHEILSQNQVGKRVAALEEFAEPAPEGGGEFENAFGREELDRPPSRSSQRKRGGKPSRRKKSDVKKNDESP